MKWKFWGASAPTYTTESQQGLGRRVLRLTGYLIGLYLAVCVFLSWWWDTEPVQFPVREAAAVVAQQNNVQLVTGYTMTATVIQIGDTVLNKRGGYLYNDLFPPGIWMDNVPEWESGVITMLRDTARVYRSEFSRSQSQSSEDPDLAEAEGKFFWDMNSWALPQTEEEYTDGVEYFRAYLGRLADPAAGNAQFYARADNLQQFLAAVETRLGDMSQSLSASVGKRQLNTDLAGDTAASQATATPTDQVVKTPWLQIDNRFYEARGYTWALIHLLRAAEHDFGDVLDKKAARVSLQQIIRELEPTQETLWSPMVLNGDGFGMLPNHSLVMASYISRANAAIIDLRVLLAQG